MADIIKAISGNDIKNGTSVTGVDGTGNIQSYFETGKDLNTPALSDIEDKYAARFDDITYYFHHGLVKGLESYYRMDEASGTREDATNALLHLTDNNTVGSTDSVTSKTETACDFTRSNGESLSLDNASLGLFSPGSADFSIAFWFYLKPGSFSSSQHLGGVWKTVGNNREYLLYYKASTKKLRFYTSSNGSATGYLESDTELAHSTWYHVVFSHETSSTGRAIFLNGAADGEDDYAVGIYQGDGDFHFGRSENSTDYLDGYIDEAGLWSRALTADDAVKLYNNGSGVRVR